jgi:hypothetical protein
VPAEDVDAMLSADLNKSWTQKLNAA